MASLHAAPLPQAAAQSDRIRFLRWSYQDAGALGWSIGTHLPYYAAIGGGLAYGTRFDDALRLEVQSLYDGTPLVAKGLDAANLLGERAVAIPAATVFALSLTTDDERFQDAAFTSLQALLYSTAITNVLKSAVGRSRPYTGDGPHETDTFSGHTSFPSGHTTTAFAVLTPWVLYYPNPATYSLFALSAGTATARVALDRHWPTDVVAGAAIGFFTARYLVRRHQDLSLEDRGAVQLQFTPLMGADALGIGLRLHLR